jgi:hypothetical protein
MMTTLMMVISTEQFQGWINRNLSKDYITVKKDRIALARTE